MTTATMIVERVEDQGDRVLIYRKEPPSRWGPYYAIAKAGDEAALALKEGDTIAYEAENGGFNFGWFLGLAPPTNSEEPQMANMPAFADPNHPGNTIRPDVRCLGCGEKGCVTSWGNWCLRCNVKRIQRISKALNQAEEMLRRTT